MGLLTLLDSPQSGVAPWVPPAAGIWPTAFSPTLRGNVGSAFGIWADNGLLTVKHDASLSWCGVRTMAGIADGTKITFKVTIQGSTSEQGIGLGNTSADLNSYSGADANGLVYFGHTGSIYYNGSEVQTLATFAAGDVIIGEVDRVADTIRFKKNGTYVGAAYGIGALGTGTLYPIANQYRSTGQQTWDFGQTAFTATSGFTRGPLGNWGWWNDSVIVAAMTETWLGADTTRLWELSTDPGVSAPNVVNNDPLGGWYGILYARLLEQSTAAQRPTYTTSGVRFNATGGTKQMADALAATFNANTPFTVLLNFDLLSGRSIRAGLGTSATTLNSGVSWGPGGKEIVTTRATATTLAATDVRNDACIVLTYDGTKAYALDSDGTWGEVTVGASTGTITHLILRAVNTESTNATVYAYQILSGAVDEAQARNLQWSARNVL